MVALVPGTNYRGPSQQGYPHTLPLCSFVRVHFTIFGHFYITVSINLSEFLFLVNRWAMKCHETNNVVVPCNNTLQRTDSDGWRWGASVCVQEGEVKAGIYFFLDFFLSLENDTRAIKAAYEFIFFFSYSELRKCIEMTCEDPLLTARSGI